MSKIFEHPVFVIILAIILCDTIISVAQILRGKR
jgi:hypothetical protein